MSLKNKLRIILGLKSKKLKNIEAQQKFGDSYKKKCVPDHECIVLRHNFLLINEK